MATAMALLSDGGQQWPTRRKLVVFSDSANAQDLLKVGLLPGPTGLREKNKLEKRKAKFYHAHTLPVVRVCVRHAHELHDRHQCDVEVRWLPRCRVQPHSDADREAGRWQRKDKRYWVNYWEAVARCSQCYASVYGGRRHKITSISIAGDPYYQGSHPELARWA
ncbi:hypothetical protein B0H66DRAFT_92789 [Apodospora peruviana]|uniref:Uncharacterized protein n=1 Tax=Apodospora peruviana TaxID=516989 RepID=A0AAE0ITY5_9PEZI|nr:hypothetical protein B0H66DRAFT_92789 [Apodospora peruviana]